MAQIKTVNVKDLVPYAQNAKVHTDKQVRQIAESIKQYGMNSLIQVWPDPEGRLIVVVGNGRLAALKKLKVKTTEVEVLDHLTDDERKAYGLIDNQLSMITPFDSARLNMELEDLGPDIDLSEYDLHLNLADEIPDKQDSQEYLDYLKKFDTVKTTDDTFTPPAIYDAVKNWCIKEYDIPDTTEIIRPFHPDGDYQKEHYPDGCIVIDNPPFSILAEIQRWYLQHHIKFFLFCEGRTTFASNIPGICHIITDTSITYDNGAVVNTGFVTSLSDDVIQTRPDLRELIIEASGSESRENNTISYPPEVLTFSSLSKLVRRGEQLHIRPKETHYVRKVSGQNIYGCGYLISSTFGAMIQKTLSKHIDQKRTIVTLNDDEKQIVQQLEGTTEAR